jgi:hypothetical protein
MFGVAAIALVILASSTAAAPQTVVTGTWAGPLFVTVEGTVHEEYIHLVLKQAGDVVSGTAGENADHQYPIKKGTVTTVRDVATLTFEFIANGVHTSFSLKAIDGLLKGDARIVGEDGHAYTATVELKPVKDSTSLRQARAAANVRRINSPGGSE